MRSTNVAAYSDDPAPSRCGWCLKPAWGDGVCRECRSIEPGLRRGYTDADALTGGYWVRRGSILVWDGPRPIDDEQPRNQYGRAKCGTNGGYVNHVRYSKTTPCGPCKKAHAEANRPRSGDAA